MRRMLGSFMLCIAMALMGGCASGVKYTEMASAIPTIKPNEGRIFFYRPAAMMGAAVQPDIRLNGEVVGESKPGGFFFVDRPAGQYTASTSTEVEKTVSFSLAPGEVKYLRGSVSFGVMVGRIVLALEDPATAKPELESLSYTGAPTSVVAKK